MKINLRYAYRVRRGGGWYFNSQYCRAASRIYDGPSTRFGFIGFRIAKH